MKKSLLLALIILGSYSGFSQVKVTSYSTYALGISVPVTGKINSELKVFTNQRHIEYTSIELNGKWKFNPGEYHQLSAGIGFGLIPNSGENAYVAVPLALDIYPLQSFKRLSLVIELAPEIYLEDQISLRHLWGISYSFGGN